MARQPTGYVRQASIKASTRRQIIRATLSLFDEKWVDEVTLTEVAESAGVTIQTVIRHFGSREGILDALGLPEMEDYLSGGEGNVLPVVSGTQAAVRVVGDLYEVDRHRQGRLMLQEARYPALTRLAREGRARHEEWVRACFSAEIAAVQDDKRERLVRKLLHLTDYYSWHLHRHVYGMSREETEATLAEMITSALGE